jgi:hypothetical protein
MEETVVRYILDQAFGDDVQTTDRVVQRVARYLKENELLESYERGSVTLATIVIHLVGFISEGF